MTAEEKNQKEPTQPSGQDRPQDGPTEPAEKPKERVEKAAPTRTQQIKIDWERKKERFRKMAEEAEGDGPSKKREEEEKKKKLEEEKKAEEERKEREKKEEEARRRLEEEKRAEQERQERLEREREAGNRPPIDSTEKPKKLDRIKQLSDDAEIGLTAKIRRRIEEEYGGAPQDSSGESDKDSGQESDNIEIQGVRRPGTSKLESIIAGFPKEISPSTRKEERAREVKKIADDAEISLTAKIKKSFARQLSQNAGAPSPLLSEMDERERLRKLASEANIGLTAKIKRSLAKQGLVYHESQETGEVSANPISCLGWLVVIMGLAGLCFFLLDKFLILVGGGK